jgi:DNA-binding NarL/FixJ family response regulator
LLEAFQKLLEPDCLVIGTATDGEQVLTLAAQFLPDVVVLDISMPRLSGIEAARLLRQQVPSARIVFLTVNEDPGLAASLLREGAAGYLLKTSAAHDLFEAIRAAMEGRTHVTPSIAEAVRKALRLPATKAGLERLSERQREILQLVVEGRTMKEIAARLDITPRTVAFHKYRMMELLGFETTAELIQYGIRHGLGD